MTLLLAILNTVLGMINIVLFSDRTLNLCLGIACTVMAILLWSTVIEGAK